MSQEIAVALIAATPPNVAAPGSAGRDDSSFQRGPLHTPTAGSSDEPLPDPDQR
jgi:hypothetical protein